MKLKAWRDCTLLQKIARVMLVLPIALATYGYLWAGMWLFWIMMRY